MYFSPVWSTRGRELNDEFLHHRCWSTVTSQKTWPPLFIRTEEIKRVREEVQVTPTRVCRVACSWFRLLSLFIVFCRTPIEVERLNDVFFHVQRSKRVVEHIHSARDREGGRAEGGRKLSLALSCELRDRRARGHSFQSVSHFVCSFVLCWIAAQRSSFVFGSYCCLREQYLLLVTMDELHLKLTGGYTSYILCRTWSLLSVEASSVVSVRCGVSSSSPLHPGTFSL